MTTRGSVLVYQGGQLRIQHYTGTVSNFIVDIGADVEIVGGLTVSNGNELAKMGISPVDGDILVYNGSSEAIDTINGMSLRGRLKSPEYGANGNQVRNNQEMDQRYRTNGMVTETLEAGNTVTINPTAIGVYEIKLLQPSTTITIDTSNVGISKEYEVLVILEQGLGANKVIWPVAVKWPFNRPPVTSYILGGKDAMLLSIRGDGVIKGTYYGAWIG